MAFISQGLSSFLAAEVKDKLDGGFIHIFSGPVPATADEAIDGASDLIVTISESGDGVTGLTFEAPVGGTIFKDSGETWSGDTINAGTMTFYRFCASGDDGTGALAPSGVRIQGVVGTDPFTSDLVVPNATVTLSATIPINAFSYNVPLS